MLINRFGEEGIGGITILFKDAMILIVFHLMNEHIAAASWLLEHDNGISWIGLELAEIPDALPDVSFIARHPCEIGANVIWEALILCAEPFPLSFCHVLQIPLTASSRIFSIVKGLHG